MADDQSEWMKLPTDDKCIHKAWKARMAGYEEAIKLFQSADEKSPEFGKYLGLVKKFVTDSNAIAQEKGVEAALAFVENAAVAGRTVGEVVGGVITKCLNASRAKTKQRGMEVLMMYIEIDKQEAVQEELIKGLSNKQPKVVVGCVMALREGLRDFGSKVVLIKPLVKLIQKLLEDRDKNVREEGKLLVVEMYRWAGPALKPQLANLKPVQITELEAEFEKLPKEKPVQVKFMRSQQDLKAKMEEQAAAATDGDGDEDGEDEDDAAAAAQEMDPYDLATAVEVLNKLPKDFHEQIEAKKWQDRREMLEAVHKLCDNLKLEPGDYGDLVRALKKVVSKDSNVMLVTLSAKCLTLLAKGLRKKFSPYATQCISAIIEKFKEKKVTVVSALRDAIDAIYPYTNLEAISEDIVEALANKNPNIRAETVGFLARCFTQCTPTTLPKKLLKMFCTPLCKTMNDTVPDVRERSYEALGVAMKVVGEKPLTPFISDIESIKLTKIKECCDKAELVNMKSKKKPTTSAPPAAVAPPAAKSAAAKAAPKAAPQKKASGAPKKPKAGGAPGKSVSGKAKQKDSGKSEVVENVLSDESVEEKAASHLPGDTLTGLTNANWKERLAAMEKFLSVVKGMSASDIPTQAFVRTINKKPGLKDTNFQVLKLRLELISYLAENSKFSKRSAEFCMTEIIDKVGDVKNGEAARNALTSMAEAISLEYVSQEAVKLAFDQKNPKNQAEALNWLAQAVKEFGFKIAVKPMIQSIKKALSATNPAIRTAAITLLGVVFMYMGGALRTLFEGEKPALLQSIDAEFDKVKGEKPPAPVRGNKACEDGGDGDEEEDEEGAADSPEAINVADLVPRNDIGDKISEALLTQLADKNWKERKEGLEKVAAILNEASFITPNVGGLPEALKARLVDSNKILVLNTLNICLTLSNAMGPSIKKYAPVLGPPIVNCCGDAKPHVRVAAVASLDALVAQTTLSPFMEPEVFSDALKLENPNLRIELLKWLAAKLPSQKKLSSELSLCIPHLYKCLEDRNPDVRKNAKEALTPFMIHTGFEAFNKACSNLKASSKDPIKQAIDKAREDLPAKPIKTKSAPSSKSAPPSKSASVPKTAPVDEPDDSSASSGPSKASSAKPKTKKAVLKGKGAAAAKAPAKKKKGEEEDFGPTITMTTTKEQRLKEEKSLKVLKWNFTAPRGEFVEQLHIQMEPNFSTSVMTQLFHTDFKAHIKAIEALIQALELREATVSNLDLILKWFTLRFFDTNPSMLNKALDYLQKLFCLLSEEDYHMNELEANAFIPYLVLKVGENKDNVRRDVRQIFKLMCKVYPASKMFNHIINGLACKNTKQKTECLEELGSLIEVYGINVCQPSPAQALKLIAQQIGERDNSVRSAALNTCVTAYMILGDGVYKYIGNLNDKDQGMLEERIKRSSKSRPPSGAPAAKAPEEKQSAPKRNQPNQEDIKRPQAAVKQQSNAQKRRTFALDLDDEDEVIIAPPTLVSHDLEDLEQPVHLPETRLRPPSPSINLVGSSQDASSAINLVISQITSIDISTSIQALAQIDEVLRDAERSSALSNFVDQLIMMISVQLRMAYSKHMGSPNTSEEDVLKLYKCLLATLLSLFQCKSLAKEASKDVLTDLIQNLVTILLDIRLNNMDEGPQVVRSVNVMVVKIIEKSDCTQVMRSLIKLQHDCVSSETYSQKYLELIMKCLWKTIRMLPTVVSELNIDQIFLDLHKFLESFPSAAWKDKSSDTPLRTVKTLLHTLAKLKGNKVMNHLQLINDAEHSEVYTYLIKVLKSFGALVNNPVSTTITKNEQQNGGDELSSPKRQRRLSKSTHDQLADIFKKIGSKENTREGLNDLYDFKKKHPEADLEPFLKKSSQFFQTYIERGLKNIELERDGQLTHSNSGGLSRVDSEPIMHGNQGSMDVNPNQYMERLKVLRARCGLDNKVKHGEDNIGESVKQEPSSDISMLGHHTASMPIIESSVPQKVEKSDTASTTAVDLADLKKRLERIKKGGL